jgi:inorganic pyrophosphatase/exopolyphosphatase
MLKSGLQKIYSQRLFGCIDHHAEENAVPKDCKDEPRIVEKSGSCMTLVMEYCKDAVRKEGSLVAVCGLLIPRLCSGMDTTELITRKRFNGTHKSHV